MLISSIAFSQLPKFEENFSYAVGTALTANTWTQIGTVATNPILVTSPGLSYDCYIKSNVGLATTLLTTGQDVYKDMSVTVSSGKLYASFMVNVTSAQTGDYFFTMCQAASTTFFAGRVHARLNAGVINFGITKAANADVTVWGSTAYATGTTYLLVLKYEFVAGATNDLVSLFVFTNCVPPNEPVTPEVGPSSFPSADPTNIGRVVLRQGTASSSPVVQIDGITITNEWNAILPVELTGFSASVDRRDVTLRWTTMTESNNSGFSIERATDINGEWSTVGFVNGAGNSKTSLHYSFTDRGLNYGSYRYRLKQIDYNGFYEYHVLSSEVNVGLPVAYNISQNYPNPFNPSTKINFDLPVDGHVSIKVFDILGNEVGALVNEKKSAGYYSVDFNSNGLSSGIYFYSIKAGSNGKNFVSTKKMTLVK